MLKNSILKMTLALAAIALVALPASAKSKALTESITIDASPEAVFNAIRSYRTSSLHHRKLISYDGTSAIVDEKIEGVPVLGNVHCTWVEKEVPYQRIDYKMIESDKFASASGSYVILPGSEHASVKLELISELDSGCHVPFAREISQAAAHKDMKMRLAQLKAMSENNKIAQAH